MAMLLRDKGQDYEPVAPANGKAFTLEEMQKYVEGYIETVNLGDGWIMVLNEEGKLKGGHPSRSGGGYWLWDDSGAHQVYRE